MKPPHCCCCCCCCCRSAQAGRQLLIQTAAFTFTYWEKIDPGFFDSESMHWERNNTRTHTYIWKRGDESRKASAAQWRKSKVFFLSLFFFFLNIINMWSNTVYLKATDKAWRSAYGHPYARRGRVARTVGAFYTKRKKRRRRRRVQRCFLLL